MINNIFQKKSCLLYKKHEKIPFEKFVSLIPENYNGLVFKTIDRDAIGRSAGKPRWGKVFTYKAGELSEEGKIAIFKEADFDEPNGPYAEKMWSILAKLIIPECKIPTIDVIDNNGFLGYPGVISYSIVDKQKEDMSDIRTVLRFNGISENDMIDGNDRIYIEDLLKYVKNFIGNDENYQDIERQIIKTILLDCITNTFDRHPDNWALVCDNETGRYTLGLYDNTVSFINMLTPRPGVVNKENWGKIFITVKNRANQLTDMSNEVVEYISNQYPQYFQEFQESLNNNINKFYEAIGSNEYKNVVNCMNKRKSYMKRLANKDMEYDY